MSDQYYDNEVLNTSVLVEGVWQQVESGANSTSETFFSVDDGCNETQYFSMLDSCNNSTILSDITGVAELNGYDESTCAVNVQPDFYRIEGSEDLYFFNVACDDDGNLQRFRYRLSLNDNGEYEGTADGIELLPLENDDTEDGIDIPESTTKILVKNEASESDIVDPSDVPDEDSNCLCVSEEIECEHNRTFGSKYNDIYGSCTRIDIKTGIIENHTLLPIQKVESVSHCKVEDPSSFEHFPESPENSFSTNNDTVHHIDLCALENNVTIEDGATLLAVNNNDDHDINHSDNVAISVQPEHIFLTDASNNDQPENQHDLENNKNLSSTSSDGEIDNGSEAEEYEIVEGVHVTGDSETLAELPSFEQLAEPVLPAYVLQIPQQTTTVSKKASKPIKISISTNPEKENVSTVPQINLIKTNPRSLLKSSYIFIEQNENEIEPETVKIDKRFLKNKEFLQARLFNNYIAQTKILHAPIRQHRLPRKQTIKPVQRNDEEIIVQEVVVSSKGFVETTEDGVMKSKIPLEPTEIVHLSDSDDEYKPKRYKLKKKSTAQKPIKEVEIVISDSNDEGGTSQISVSDIEDAPVKKKRGRPLKRITSAIEKPSLPDKKHKPNSTDISTIKTRWKCEQCPKSFPSQGSLKSHMQYHNFHEPKYKCVHCSEFFKNSILLSNHLKNHKFVKTYQCNHCKVSYPSQTELAIHRRTHAKDLLLKATEIFKYSPKSTNKTPLKNHQCYFCPNNFSTRDLLNAHQKTHMQFSCKNCGLKFASKLILEAHMRQKCVKISNKASRIPHFVNESKQTGISLKGFTKTSSNIEKILSCDSCTNKFNSFQNLYRHKVLVHSFKTSNNKQITNENVFGKKK